MKTQVLLDGLCFPEGPRWHDGRLWFSDFYDHVVVRMDEDGWREDVVEVPQQPSGLGFLADGTLLIVSMLDRKLMRWADGQLTEHADLNGVATFQYSGSNSQNAMMVTQLGAVSVANPETEATAEEMRW